VAFSDEKFRREVFDSAAQGVGLVPQRKANSEAEVTHLQVTRLVHQNVLRLVEKSQDSGEVGEKKGQTLPKEISRALDTIFKGNSSKKNHLCNLPQIAR